MTRGSLCESVGVGVGPCLWPEMGYLGVLGPARAACKDDVDATDEIRRFAAQRMEFARSPKKPPQSTQPRHQPFISSAQASLASLQSSSSGHDLCTVSPSSEATIQATAGGQVTPSTLSPDPEFKPIQPGRSPRGVFTIPLKGRGCMPTMGFDAWIDAPRKVWINDPTVLRGDGTIGSGELLMGPLSGRCLTPEEEFRQRREAIIAKQRIEVKRTQKEAVIAFVKQRQSPLPGGASLSGLPQHQQQQPISPTSENTPPLPNFTIRRGLDRAREELELLGRMRAIIEARLKMTLPENLAGALTDGVVLCHLANNVRPRSVATIHVPSAANPKLTMAKCRRNVDNFLDACRRLGVPPVFSSNSRSPIFVAQTASQTSAPYSISCALVHLIDAHLR
ncbi:leucine-rich repeat and calponin homology domain-containing protein 3-like [Tropilaelaps mercedesae]|uniref:Leucine-rich repeat and calponin homology domain-containing protein 3-like n=1 Tax=Tropilaelaps mercedesae TaxID=418985 RepID=A0A1V9XL95_9ACAR|nr:leucine-rich repeat and calponin homology domain-containing protein 3-like [Tropilaelaps mercedesae]